MKKLFAVFLLTMLVAPGIYSQKKGLSEPQYPSALPKSKSNEWIISEG